MLLGVLEIRADTGLSGLGCFWDAMVIGGDFEAGAGMMLSAGDGQSYSPDL